MVPLGNGSGTDFGASQCIPMGPCRLTLRLPLGVVIALGLLVPVSDLLQVRLLQAPGEHIIFLRNSVTTSRSIACNE